MEESIIVWLRQDLRLTDNPALYYAAQQGLNLIILYILDETIAWPLGGAQQWWLYHSLSSLQQDLLAQGAILVLKRGPAKNILVELISSLSIKGIYWNRCYEPAMVERDNIIKKTLQKKGIEVKDFNAHLLYEPWEIKNKQGEPFRLFTPFWKQYKFEAMNKLPLPAPEIMLTSGCTGDNLKEWSLLPVKPDWAKGLQETWSPGEGNALVQLKLFIEESLSCYIKQRDFLAAQYVSRLSPYLHFGELSILQVLQALKQAEVYNSAFVKSIEGYLRQCVWREFSYHLLYHYPHLVQENFRKEFNYFKWNNNQEELKAWQKGLTGYPLVDAGMRELWSTGYLHNRLRMIVASFLTKHLLIDWREGAQWFWDTLVDADLANNAVNWQWVAGCGIDPAPYFRVFNPITQAEKFDPHGHYIRKWLPELKALDNKAIHRPWLADHKIDYPPPIVEHAFARQRALVSFSEMRARAFNKDR